MALVKYVGNIPTEKHYAILTDVLSVESDGWGGNTREYYMQYESFFDKRDWEEEISIRAKFPKDKNIGFRAIIVEPIVIKINVSVE